MGTLIACDELPAADAAYDDPDLPIGPHIYQQQQHTDQGDEENTQSSPVAEIPPVNPLLELGNSAKIQSTIEISS